MHWIYLFIAIILEVAGTAFIKFSDGFRKILPSTLVVILYILSFITLTLALKKIPLGTAYAIWAGIGTAMIAVIGMIFFKEIFTVSKIIFIILIVLGVIGLNLSEVTH